MTMVMMVLLTIYCYVGIGIALEASTEFDTIVSFLILIFVLMAYIAAIVTIEHAKMGRL